MINFWKLAVDLIEKTFTEDKTPTRQFQSALNKGRMRKTNQIKNLPNQSGIYRFVNQVTDTIDYVGQTNNIKDVLANIKVMVVLIQQYILLFTELPKLLQLEILSVLRRDNISKNIILETIKPKVVMVEDS